MADTGLLRRSAFALILALGAALLVPPPVASVALARSGPDGHSVVERALPPLADPETIAATLSTRFRVYRLARKPRVLVLDFPSRHAQSAALDRVAVLIEAGDAPRDRVLEPAAVTALLKGRRRPTGHDYSARALARFFTLAGTSVTAAEQRIRSLAVANKLIRRSGVGYKPGAKGGAMLSISRMKDRVGGLRRAEIGLRRAVLRHELAHGWFFVDSTYRMRCRQFWIQDLTAAERAVIRRTLSRLGYDGSNETLMANEAQAYIGFTKGRLLPRRHMGLPAERFETLRQTLLVRLAGNHP